MHGPIDSWRPSALRIIGVAAAVALALSGGPALALTPVFVNEIHYDDSTSTGDVGEAIEIAGPAGTSLSGWSVVRYNGANGQSYTTPAQTNSLPASIPGALGTTGFVTLTYATNGIQNGAPDGVALVDGSGIVVQFLSYEGTFTATNGFASGMTSTDIGVSETNSTPPGHSLQLKGTGTSYEDFTWSAPAANTFGSANNGQTFGGGATDTAPTVLSTSPVNNAANVAVDSAIVVTFSEPVSASGAFALACNGSNRTLDVSTSNDTVYTLSPDADLPFGASCTVTVTASLVTDRDGTADPMGADYSFAFDTEAALAGCGAPATLISTVQGEGTTSPLVGQVAIVEAVVVGDFQPTDGSGLSGFFLQEEDGDQDGNALTSEGIFVFYLANAVAVSTGDVVRVTGSVAEFKRSSDATGNTLTQLASVTAIEVCTTGNPIPEPATVQLPLPNDPTADLEPFEGMYVELKGESGGDLTLVEYFNLDRFGEIRVSGDGRPYQFTHMNDPSIAGYAAHRADIARSTLLIDDGRSGQNRYPIFFGRGGQPLSVEPGSENLLRGGDTVASILGAMHYDFGVYRLQPTASPNFVTGNERPEQAPAVGGGLKVVSYNVLNYFQQLDDGTAKCGPPDNLQECRGADLGPVDSQGRNERDRQEAKLIPALLKLGADIYGLVELENDFGSSGTSSAQNLADLMNAFNATQGVTDCSRYAAVDPGDYVGTDAIAVGILYCTDTVDLASGTSVEILDDSDLPGLGLGDLAPVFNGEATSRAALAATFQESATGAALTVVVNHFKSKGDSGLAGDPICQSSPALNPNCDQGDGQGFWNQRRLDAAVALDAWLKTRPTGTGDPDILIIGDLNSYSKEDSIAYLESQGYENLVDSFGGPDASSYLFDAQLGYLDYALASRTLQSQVAGAAEWHINADEPDALDYDISFNNERLFAEDEYRTSDHDPVLVGLELPRVLSGTAGRDRLTGTLGRDEIVGGLGADTLTGGGGADLFVYSSLRDGADIITDFEVGVDMVDLSRLLIAIGAGPDPIGSGVVRLIPASGGATLLVDPDGTAGRGRGVAIARLAGLDPATNLASLFFLP